MSVLTDKDWQAIAQHLDQRGYAVVKSVLPAKTCESVSAWYDDRARFRRVVHMARHQFGQGTYAYFRRPVPGLVGKLQLALYARLRPIAQRWYDCLGIAFTFPADYADFQGLCHRAGQVEPAALMLDYGAGDHNYLHQDLYGDCVFPMQMNIQLNRPGVDFDGGEFVLTDQHPRRQSRVQVVSLNQGDACLFATSVRPVQGSRGYYRATLRHGVSDLREGHRRALGVILHNAPS